MCVTCVEYNLLRIKICMKLGYCFNIGGPNTNQHAIENKK